MARQELRSLEIAEIRDKTKRVMQTLELNQPGFTTLREPRSFFDNRVITLTIRRFGVAFPLTLDDELIGALSNSPSDQHTTTTSVPAFLLSVAQVEFTTRRYEVGKAEISDFSIQFVPR